VNDFAAGAGSGLFAGDRSVLELGVDELFDGGFVAVGELGGVEDCGLALDEFLGQGEGVCVDGVRLDGFEIGSRVAEFGCIAKGIGHEAEVLGGLGFRRF